MYCLCRDLLNSSQYKYKNFTQISSFLFIDFTSIFVCLLINNVFINNQRTDLCTGVCHLGVEKYRDVCSVNLTNYRNLHFPISLSKHSNKIK